MNRVALRTLLAITVAGSLAACTVASPSTEPPRPTATMPDTTETPAPPPAEAGPSSADASSLAPSSARCAPVTGTVRVAVLVVNAGAARVSCSVEDVRSTFHGASGTPAFYRESSYGQLDVQGDVFGPIEIPASDTCVSRDDARATTETLRGWYAQADAAAAAAGIDLSGYDRRVYVMGEDAACDKRGGGVARPALGRAWVFRCDQGSIYAHELGHTLGVNHASTADGDYGDGSDVMGHGLFQLNGPHRAQLGWLPPDRVVSVTTSGVFKIGVLETPQPIPQVLVVPRRDDPSQALFLSARAPVGFDATLGPEFVGRTSVHQFSATCPNAGANGFPPPTMLLQAIGDGETLTDDAAGITVTQVEHDAVSATVRIGLAAR